MGEVGIVDYDDPNTFLGQRIMQYRANPTKLDSNFLLYSFLSPDLQYQFRKHDNSGSIVSHIRVPDCFEFEINTPPLETQKAISKVLSDLDYKISLNNRINQELEAVAKLIYDYWFVQFDFPMTKEQAEAMGKSELVGKPYKSSGGKMVYNEQLKREIPEGWGVKELADIADTINDSVDPSNEPDRNFKYYSIPIWDDKKSYELTRGAEIGSNKYSVNDKRILVSKLNPWFSRVVFASDNKDTICSTEFVVWQPKIASMKCYLVSKLNPWFSRVVFASDNKDTICSTEFVVYCLHEMLSVSDCNSSNFIAYSTQNATGTSNSHKRVNPKVMMKYKVAFNEEFAISYSKRMRQFIQQMQNNQKQNQKLSELRDWLLPMLMNGQVRVSDKLSASGFSGFRDGQDLGMVAEEGGEYGS
jgi:type I restriction enzyme S subunit